jgi:hypothetical protein
MKLFLEGRKEGRKEGRTWYVTRNQVSNTNGKNAIRHINAIKTKIKN